MMTLAITMANMDMLDKIPGQFGDRRTMLGELNWYVTFNTVIFHDIISNTFLQ